MQDSLPTGSTHDEGNEVRSLYRRMVVFAAAATAVMSLAFAAPASAEEVTGVQVDAPIMMAGPNGELIPVPDAEVQHGPVIRPQSWTNCDRYETLFLGARHACFNINGSGLWANSQSVWFDASRTGNDPYTYVNARFNVDRPNGMYFWGTNGGAVNIMNGYAVTVPINNFIEAGTWCMRYQLQRTNGVWEGWRQTCGPVWA